MCEETRYQTDNSAEQRSVCSVMESYEEFSSRTLQSLLSACSSSPPPQRALVSSSQLRFSGRTLLEPVLSVDQRAQMLNHRHTAVQRDRNRHRRHTDALLQRVQDVLVNIQQLNNPQNAPAAAVPSSSSSSVCSDLKRETLRLLNQRMEKRLSENSPDSSLSLSLSVTGSYTELPTLPRFPGPQVSHSPPAQRRPRAHRIIISSPVSQSQLGSESASSPSAVSETSDGQLSIKLKQRRSNDEEEKRRPVSQSQLSSESASSPSAVSETSDGQLSIKLKQRSSGDEAEKRRPVLNRSYDVENPCPSLNRPQVEEHSSSRVEQIEELQHLQQCWVSCT
nr:uncharacterized protein LOC100006699 isoform X2 [Danio rerio]|eukprot:XP_021336122.1 uncharacterized protein LOC100006699 isoform X2 [Danio rerio]